MTSPHISGAGTGAEYSHGAGAGVGLVPGGVCRTDSGRGAEAVDGVAPLPDLGQPVTGELNHKGWQLPTFPTKIKRKDWYALAGLSNDLYARLQDARMEDWGDRVLAFEANPTSTYNAYYYIAMHPMFWYFEHWHEGSRLVHEIHLVHEDGWRQVYLHPALVNPADHRISNDPQLNTHQEWWYEFGPTLWSCRAGRGVNGHDWECDGGAPTYDAAILEIAAKIHEVYGNDRREVVKKWEDSVLPKETSP